jgi:uncharacterized membrane protein
VYISEAIIAWGGGVFFGVTTYILHPRNMYEIFKRENISMMTESKAEDRIYLFVCMCWLVVLIKCSRLKVRKVDKILCLLQLDTIIRSTRMCKKSHQNMNS